MSRPETLAEMLAEVGVRPKSLATGSSAKLVCPRCNGGTSREQSLSLTIDPDGAGAVMQCHRGHCGWQHGARLSSAPAPARRQVSFQDPPVYEPVEADRPDALYEFFNLRSISPDTVDHFGLYLADKSFHNREKDSWVKHPCIAFPYTFGSKVVNRKYRALAGKNWMMQEKEPQPTLYNIDSVTADDVVIWVEGEPDVMACHEAGYRQIVTLKDGAPDQLRAEDDPARADDKRFAALTTHADKLGGIKKFILAGDDDQPGRILREELARRLGRHRCWTIEWFEGCKDAGDVLRQFGPVGVRHCINGARPWPIEGVRTVTGKSLLEYQRQPAPRTMRTGIPALDKIVRLPTEGRLIVVTGFPNHGKSLLTMNLMVNTMLKEGRRFAAFSPEMEPFEEFMLQCAQIYSGKPARKSRRHAHVEAMEPGEIDLAGDWMRDRLFFISNDAEVNPPTLDWLLTKAEDCALRYGITDLLVDPFNELEQEIGKGTETQFIGRALQRFKAFGKRHGCNVWVIAHPAKPARDRNGAITGAPGPYDISGSSNWANKSDIGITVYTPGDATQIILWKARFARFGRKGGAADVKYDQATCRYVSE